MKATTETKPSDAALTRELLEIGLEMQDRFSAEPIYAKTGKGFLKSAGVEELKKIKAAQAAKKP
ncbi:MAG: hypothetical protein WAW39_02455 [Prosthecobacter sp.]|uniref:hypothetical protein n=1 Tax=Prosthecobacter sp. TaxID=1965333 RepID=UPI003BAE5B5D